MISFIKRMLGIKGKPRRCGWVNVYKTQEGNMRLSGGNVYKSKRLAVKARKKSQYTVSDFIGTAKVYYVIEGEKP